MVRGSKFGNVHTVQNLSFYKNFSKPYTRFCNERELLIIMGVRKSLEKLIKLLVLIYLQTNNLSDGKDKPGHEGLDIYNIMFQRVYL